MGSSASFWASQAAQWVKNLPAMQRTQADLSLIPRSGRVPGGGHGNQLQYSFLAWRIPWTEEPGGLQSIGSPRVGQDWSNSTHSCCIFLPHTEVLSSGSIKITFRAAKTQIAGTLPGVPDSESAFLIKPLSGESAAASGPHSEDRGTKIQMKVFKIRIGLPSQGLSRQRESTAFCPSSQVEMTTVAITLSHQVQKICLNTKLPLLWAIQRWLSPFYPNPKWMLG